MENNKKKPGRPLRFRESMIKEVEEMTAEGKTIDQIAAHYNVDRVTLFRWQKKFDGFGKALKSGRDMQVERVVESLFRRATGYDYEEVKEHAEKVQGKDGNEVRKVTRMEKVKKHVPADVGAAAFLLKNLQPERFRDKHDLEHSGDMKITYDSILTQDKTFKDTEDDVSADAEATGCWADPRPM